MATHERWTREQLLIAFKLYCHLPFGKLHFSNPEIIKYAELIGRTPSALAMKLTNIASLDPKITQSGRTGLANTSQNDKKMWEEMNSNWESFALESHNIENIFLEKKSLHSTIKQFKNKNFTGKNKTTTTQTRIGQNFFRNSVLSAYNYKCCITGLDVPRLLIASHIVPWSEDESNRLNPSNGLCLSALHDKAFDLGFITIAENMTVQVSKFFASNSSSFFKTALSNFAGRKISIPEKFQPSNEFLEYHRKNIFEANL